MGEVGDSVGPRSSVDQLWEEVWRQPWAMQVRLVLGDALQEAGDAHGELIAVQLALERLPDDDDEGGDSREARDALEARQAQLLLRLKSRLVGRHSLEHLVWRAGFIDSATVHDVSELSSLLEARAAWAIRDLRFLGVLDDFRDLLRRLEDGRAAPLESLRLGDRGEMLGCERAFRVKALFEALPRLRHLELWSASPDFTGVTALRLEHLTVDPSFDEARVLSSLGHAHCPALKSLTLSLVDSDVGLPPALLSSKTLGPIEALTLDGPFEPEAVQRVLTSALGRRVKKLRVRVPTWLRWPGSVDWGASLERVEAFEVLAPHWSAKAARALEASHAKLRVRHVP